MQLEYHFAHKRGATLEALFIFREDISAATLTSRIEVSGDVYDITNVSIVDAEDYEVSPPTDVADFTVVEVSLEADVSADWPIGQICKMEVDATFASGRVVKSSTIFVKIQAEV